MALSASQRLAYFEAYRRWTRGAATPGWHGDEMGVRIWMDAFDAAGDLDITPATALLAIIARRAARVDWVDSIIAGLLAQHVKDTVDATGQMPLEPPDSVRDHWLEQSRHEEAMLIKATKITVDAGVAVELDRRRGLEGTVVLKALLSTFDTLGLTQDQKLQALAAVHQAMAEAGNVKPRSIGPATDNGDDHAA